MAITTEEPPLQTGRGEWGAAVAATAAAAATAATPTLLIQSDTLLSSTCPHEAHVMISYREAGFIKWAPFHFLFYLSKYEKKESVDLFSCRR